MGLLLAAVVVSPVDAQMIVSPPGAVGGIFGGKAPVDARRSSQKLSVTADASTGEDTVPSESLTPGDPTPRILRNRATTAAFGAQYSAGRIGKLFEAGGGGFLNRESSRPDQLNGANGQVRMTFGTRTGMTLASSLLYQPLTVQSTTIGTGSSTGTSGPAASNDASMVGPPNSVNRQNWLTSQGAVTFFRNATPRRRFDGTVSAWSWRPLEGTGFTNSSLRASGQYSSRISPLNLFYLRYNLDRIHQAGVAQFETDTTLHSPSVALQLQRRYTPVRSLLADFEFGVTQVLFDGRLTASSQATVPVGSAQLQWVASRTWRLTGGVRRDVMVLNGFTNQPFASVQATGELAGTLSRRLRTQVSSSFVRGRGVVDQQSDFDSATHMVRVQYGVANWCGLFASYSYYQQTFDLLQSTPNAALANAGRHAVRGGVSLWLPLFGSF